ncbi:MAG: hypothetical protein VKQ33_14475 [Candidatus Sericytochromatia bacterium]|nr:hypothetical protein [Candidatus Sericytochromatia bacterium]
MNALTPRPFALPTPPQAPAPLAPPPAPAPAPPALRAAPPPVPQTILPQPPHAYPPPPPGAVRPAHVEQEAWYWVRLLRFVAPATAGLGLVVGGAIGLAAGAPALGAAWGAAVLTGVPGVTLAVDRLRHTAGHLLRGEGLGPRPGEDLRFVGGVLLPTGAVALGTALAVGTGLAAFGGLLGAGALELAGRVYLRGRQG